MRMASLIEEVPTAEVRERMAQLAASGPPTETVGLDAGDPRLLPLSPYTLSPCTMSQPDLGTVSA